MQFFGIFPLFLENDRDTKASHNKRNGYAEVGRPSGDGDRAYDPGQAIDYEKFGAGKGDPVPN
mgnify:CR=1 FL=1